MAIDLSDFVLDPVSKPPELEIYHRGGVDWIDAPLPERRHQCWTQTFAWTNLFTAVHRCPCGAIKITPDPRWGERNSRHPDPSGETPEGRTDPERQPTALEYVIERLARAMKGGRS